MTPQPYKRPYNPADPANEYPVVVYDKNDMAKKVNSAEEEAAAKGFTRTPPVPDHLKLGPAEAQVAPALPAKAAVKK